MSCQEKIAAGPNTTDFESAAHSGLVGDANQLILGEQEQVKTKFQYWNSWIAMSLSATCCFAVCNITISQVSYLGVAGIYYFSAGSLLTSLIYWFPLLLCRRSSSGTTAQRRVLVRDDNGKVDPILILCFVVGAGFCGGMYLTAQATFQYSLRAGLNPGIATSIWAMAPFLSALFDWILFKKSLEIYQFVGMGFLVACAIMVSLSDLIQPETATESLETEEKVPLYVPILISAIMPWLITFENMLCRYTQEIRKVGPFDFAQGQFFILKLVCVLASIPYFMNNEIDWSLYIMGSIGSIFEVAGFTFALSAIETGFAIGPITALTDSQILIVMIVFCVWQGIWPLWLQWLGFCFGLFGAMILTVPEVVMFLVSCGNWKQSKKQEIEEDDDGFKTLN